VISQKGCRSKWLVRRAVEVVSQKDCRSKCFVRRAVEVCG
jgi:hypothetical protein